MIDLALDTEEQMKRMTGPMGNPQQMPQAAPIKKGMGEEFTDMAKQRAMSGALDAGQEGIMQGIGSMAGPSAAQTAGLQALAPAAGGLSPGASMAVMGNAGMAGTTGATLAGGAGAGAGMAAIGTAMPYVGAGLLAGKALGLFNQGGQVGPLSAQYHAGGNQVYGMGQSIPNPFVTEAELLALYDKMQGYPGTGSATPNLSYEAFKKQQGMRFSEGGQVPQYNAQGTMTEDQAMALMNNQPEPMSMPMARPDELYDEIMMEQVGPLARPQLQDPYGADRTFSPYDMLRPDNAPNT